MKNLEEIFKQEPVYLGLFDSKDNVLINFNCYKKPEGYYNRDSPDYNSREYVNKDLYENVNIIFAFYTDEDYSGEAFVLFEKEGRLYEVNGSHCSCYGLEDQWEPSETSLEELKYRLVEGKMGEGYYGNKYGAELKQFLGI